MFQSSLLIILILCILLFLPKKSKAACCTVIKDNKKKFKKTKHSAWKGKCKVSNTVGKTQWNETKPVSSTGKLAWWTKWNQGWISLQRVFRVKGTITETFFFPVFTCHTLGRMETRSRTLWCWSKYLERSVQKKQLLWFLGPRCLKALMARTKSLHWVQKQVNEKLLKDWDERRIGSIVWTCLGSNLPPLFWLGQFLAALVLQNTFNWR